MVFQDLGIAALTTAIKGLADAMAFAEMTQKASLALGETYRTATDKLDGTMEGLRGSIRDQMQAGLAGMEAGMQGNTAGLAKLVNQQILTGTTFAKTAKTMASMEATLGLSRDATSAFAESFIDTGAEWQVSTDKLVDAVNSLQESFPAQALAGMGDNVVKAVAQLTGEFGPQLAGPLNSVMKMVMDTSMKGYERINLLGIGDVRERLSAAKSGAEAQAILKEAIVTASEKFKTIAGGADKAFFKIGIASDVFGKGAINFTTLQQAFGERVKESGKDAFDFGAQLSVIKAEVLAPLRMAFAEVYPIMIAHMKDFGVIAVKFSTQLGDWITNNMPLLEQATKSLTLAFMDFTIWIAETANTVAKHLRNLTKVFEAKSVFDDVRSGNWMGVIMTGMESRDKARASKENGGNLFNIQILKDLRAQMEEAGTIARKQQETLENIDDNTAKPIDSTPAFLDETANMIGRQIEGILGIGRDTTQEEIAEHLAIANEQRQGQYERNGGGWAPGGSSLGVAR
jgi:hypothetical protein